jgi:broad specificity phosphatase PhoE
VVRGAILPDFWRADLTTHPSYSWYLERVRAAVHSALEGSGAKGVVLVCHSAGGWLGRAFLGDPQWFDGAAQDKGQPGTISPTPNPWVQGLVTLGTPHMPPPAGVALLAVTAPEKLTKLYIVDVLRFN